MIFSNRSKVVIIAFLAMFSASMYFIWGGRQSAGKPLIRCLESMTGTENSLKSTLQGKETKHLVPNGQKEVRTKNPLPEIAIARRVWFKYPNKKWHGLQLPLITCYPQGRFGNCMGEYATIYAIGRIYGVTVRQIPAMRNQLIQIFSNITVPVLPVTFNSTEFEIVSLLTFTNYAKIEVAAAGILGAKPFLLTGWAFEMQLFNTYRHDLIKEFKFHKKLQDQVRKYWKEKLGNNTSTVRIGIHVRRTDYVNFIHQFKIPALPGDAYFKRATDHYRAKFNDVRFLVASDDMPFVKKLFANYTDVLYAPGSPRELDMAVLASCNHSIITIGSFGFWCGYLTGGEVVYPNVNASDNYMFQKSYYDLAHMDHFTPLPPY